MKADEQLELLALSEEVAGIGHWRLTLATGDLFWSPEVYRIHGVSPEAYTPTLETGVDAYHPDDRDRVKRIIGQAIERRESFEFKLRLLRPDGEMGLVECSGRCRLDDSGELDSLFGVFQDVTERFAELRRRNEGLEHLSYAIAHDLRAPLNTIVGFTELLERTTPSDPNPKVAVYLRKITEQAETMKALVTQVMQFAKSTATHERWEPVSLSQLVTNAADSLSIDISKGRASLEVQDLPTVLGMPLQLQLLFQNLIQNALKYAKPEAPARIEVSARTVGAQVLVSIRDNGIGFDNDRVASDLFRPFRRLAGDLNERDGMGMGLAICRRVMNAHGGTITAQGRPGHGATFTLTFAKS